MMKSSKPSGVRHQVIIPNLNITTRGGGHKKHECCVSGVRPRCVAQIASSEDANLLPGEGRASLPCASLVPPASQENKKDSYATANTAVMWAR